MKAALAVQVLAVLPLAVGLSAGDVRAAAISGSGATRPNILFVLCDELGINDLHCYTDWVPTLLDLVGQPIPAGLDGVSIAALLTGRGPAPVRQFFWHFPHYTNQGSRPSGAVRDGNWMLVEYYDEEKAELYDLRKDIGESQDLTGSQLERVSEMRAALAVWRKETNAQGNTPNPAFDPAK
jgi:arylsulfatase A-like enzyme